MPAAPEQVAWTEEVGYLEAQWNRTKISAFPQGITVPDPGHGRDEVCPITVVGTPFDAGKDSDVGVFTAAEVADQSGQDGVGFLIVEVKSRAEPEVMTPGENPETRHDVWLEVTIATPAGRGPALPMLYAGILAMLFRRVTFNPAVSGIDYIRNLQPFNEHPVFDGDDGAWTFHTISIPLTRFYRQPGAGAQ